jgi:hypothetical protein
MGLFLKSDTHQSATVPEDQIVPLNLWDTALCIRGTVLDISLIFDDVLDISKLHGALEQLFDMDDWKQLGARLRMNVGGFS